MEDRNKLKCVINLFGGARKLAGALKITPSSVSRRLSGEIAISERDKQTINLVIDDHIRKLQVTKW